MSRILIWSPNYAPETAGIPPLVTDAAEWFAEQGHEVNVVAPFPNYPERQIYSQYRGKVWESECVSGVRVHRHLLRVRPNESVLDKVLYELTVAGAGLPYVLRYASQADVVVCVVPTLLAATCAATLSRVKPVVLWVQDLVAAAAEGVTGAPRVARIAEVLERRAALRARKVVVCSPGFATHFARLGVPEPRIAIVLNWADTTRIRPRSPRPGTGVVRFLYAGNLGYSQGFDTLLDATSLAGAGVRTEIVGRGNAELDVERRAATIPNVQFRKRLYRHAYPELLASADVHVVLQRRSSAGVNLPSKIATALASGRPVVAAIDKKTPAARLLAASGGAVLVEPENPRALADAMNGLAEDAERRRLLGERGRRFAEAELSKESLLPRLEQEFLAVL